MDLLVNTYGTRIRSTSERIVLVLPKEKEKREYPIRSVEKIVIMCASSISSDAVRLALENNVDIVYLSSYGTPVGRIFPSTPKGLSDLRRAQLTMKNSSKELMLAKDIVVGKAKNQIQYLKYLQKEKEKDLKTFIEQAEKVLDTLIKFPGNDLDKARLLGFEGHIAERYFAALQELYKFPGRKSDGKDKFNTCLNYGYGILYHEVERACQYVGLDPNVGVYHTERYGKPSLVLDMVEEFRTAVVDSVLFPLFLNGILEKSSNYVKKDDRYILSSKGKKVLVSALYTRLDEKIQLVGKHIQLKNVFEYQVRALGRVFTGQSEEYIPFNISALSFSPAHE